MSDAVNHPKHYNTGRIEVIEFLEDQRLGLHLGAVVKYVCRAGRKDPAKRIEDLEKALWYLRRKLELLKAKAQRRHPVRPNEMNQDEAGSAERIHIVLNDVSPPRRPLKR